MLCVCVVCVVCVLCVCVLCVCVLCVLCVCERVCVSACVVCVYRVKKTTHCNQCFSIAEFFENVYFGNVFKVEKCLKSHPEFVNATNLVQVHAHTHMQPFKGFFE